MKSSRSVEKERLHRRIRELSAGGFSIDEIAYRLAVTPRMIVNVLAVADAEARVRRARMERRDAELAASYRTERLAQSPASWAKKQLDEMNEHREPVAPAKRKKGSPESPQ